MAKAFVSQGASAVIGWNTAVSAPRTDEATELLLRHLVTDRLDVQQAVTSTMREVGPDPENGAASCKYRRRQPHRPCASRHGARSARRLVREEAPADAERAIALVEDDGLVAVDEHPLPQVQVDGARQDDLLQVATLAHQVIDLVAVADAGRRPAR